MKSIIYYIKRPKDFLKGLLLISSRFLSDKTYLRLYWKINMNYKLDLAHPKTFNEKLQWIKLYDHNPLYTMMVDKYKVKEYVKSILGDEYVIPLLGVWDRAEDIQWNELPEQFVIKNNHNSQGVIVCKDKSFLDIASSVKKLKKGFKHNYFYNGREWPYKNVEPKIFAEKYMEDEYGELRDYKWFCFNGVPKMLYIATDRGKPGEDTKFDFFDMDFNHLPFENGHHNAKECPEKPIGFDKMKELAARLSQNIPEVRVDFYDVNGHIYFGEFTFFHFGGLVPFEPEEWDYTLGKWIELPEKTF